MSNREDLEAALRRIATLQLELAAAREEASVAPDSQTDEAASLRAQNANEMNRLGKEELTTYVLEQWHEQAEEKLAVLQKELAARAPRRRSLIVHNRAFEPLDRGKGAGVLCPRCLTAGEEVEMMFDPPFVAARVQSDLYQPVGCPRCLARDLVRTS